MLENNVITNVSCKAIEEIIYNNKRCNEIGEYNFALAKKYFSYQTIWEKLEELLVKATKK